MPLSPDHLRDVAQQLRAYGLIDDVQLHIVGAYAHDPTFAEAFEQAAYTDGPQRSLFLGSLFSAYSIPSANPDEHTWMPGAGASAPLHPPAASASPQTTETGAPPDRLDDSLYGTAPAVNASHSTSPTSSTAPPPPLAAPPTYAFPTGFAPNRKVTFTGNFGDYFITTLGLSLLTAITFGLAMPYMIYWQASYFFKRLHIGNKRIVLTGSFGDYFVTALGLSLLSLITCGLALPYFAYWSVSYFFNRLEVEA